MHDINLPSRCFTVQWKFNLRSRPASAGSRRRKRSTNSHPMGEVSLFWILWRAFCHQCRGWSLPNGGSVQSGGSWIGRLLPSGPLPYHHPGICPAPSKDQSMPHPAVSDTRSWCCPKVVLRPWGTSNGSLGWSASLLPTTPASYPHAIPCTLLYLTGLLCMMGGIQIGWILRRICPGGHGERIKL